MASFLASVKGKTVAHRLFSRGLRAVPAWEDPVGQRLKMAATRSESVGDIGLLTQVCRDRPGAIVLLSPGTVVVDLDRKAGVDGVAWWLREIGPLPTRATVRTPSGGVHVWVAFPSTRYVPTRVDAWAPGVDLIGTSATTPMPGSRTTRGEYGAVSDFTLLRAPQKLVEMLPRDTTGTAYVCRGESTEWGLSTLRAFARELRTARYVDVALNRVAFMAGQRSARISEDDIELLVDVAVDRGMREGAARNTATQAYRAGQRSAVKQ